MLLYTEIWVSTPCIAYIFLSARVVTECLVTHHDISQLSYYYYLYCDLWAEILPVQSEQSELCLAGKGGRPRSRRYTHVLVLSDTSDTASRVASNGLGDEWSKEKERARRGREDGNVPQKNTGSCSCEDGNRHPLRTRRRSTWDLLLLSNCCARTLMNERINERFLLHKVRFVVLETLKLLATEYIF